MPSIQMDQQPNQELGYQEIKKWLPRADMSSIFLKALLVALDLREFVKNEILSGNAQHKRSLFSRRFRILSGRYSR
jgi:hypothetical protein